MKSNEIIIRPILTKHLDNFIEEVRKHPKMENTTKEFWYGEHIFDIILTKTKEYVGYVSYSNWDNNFCLSCLIVFEPYRHKGIGTATVKKLLFNNKDYDTHYGFVYNENKYAIQMYRNLGFKFIDKRYSKYIIDNPIPELCKMDENGFYEFGIENNGGNRK